MNTTKIIYWLTTGLFTIQFTITAILNLMHHPEAMTTIRLLGYPDYIASFIGGAKLLGLAVIFVPQLKRWREWGYAGLIIDAALAFYSFAASGNVKPAMIAAAVAITLLFTSLIFGNRLLLQKK
jgi:hypothetical protein